MTRYGPIRLTLDEDLCAMPANDLVFNTAKEGMLLSKDQVVLELKFRYEMPLLFKLLVEEFALNPQPVSKYRLSMEAFSAAKNAEPPAVVMDPRNGVPVPGQGSSDISPRIVKGNPAPEKSDV